MRTSRRPESVLEDAGTHFNGQVEDAGEAIITVYVVAGHRAVLSRLALDSQIETAVRKCVHDLRDMEFIAQSGNNQACAFHV